MLASLSLLARKFLASILFPYTTLFRSLAFTGLGALILGLGLSQAADKPNKKKKNADKNLVADTTPVKTTETTPAGKMEDRKSTRLNSSHVRISYAVFCLKTKNWMLLNA